MSGCRKERADAARNRRAILTATEELLAAHRACDISMEQVATEAKVGKGTIFHRFGSRVGLMTALMRERAQALSEAITNGPPPLGPGAPDRDRLLAFLDAVVDTVARNKSLLAELAHTAVTEPAAGESSGRESSGRESSGRGVPGGELPSGVPDEARAHTGARPAAGAERGKGMPVYALWHGHLTLLLAALRPDVDACLIAHLVLGALHSGPVLARLAADGPDAVAAALRTTVGAVIDAPASPAEPRGSSCVE